MVSAYYRKVSAHCRKLSWLAPLLGCWAYEFHSTLLSAYICWGGKGLASLVSFRDFLKVFSCLPPELKELSCRMKCFTSLRTSQPVSFKMDCFISEDIIKQYSPSPSFPLCLLFSSCWKTLVVHKGWGEQWPEHQSMWRTESPSSCFFVLTSRTQAWNSQLGWEAGGWCWAWCGAYARCCWRALWSGPQVGCGFDHAVSKCGSWP